MYTSIDKDLLEEYNQTRLLGAKPLFCYVPFNNIFFSFSGKVISCPYNQQVVLGKYPESKLLDIWHSEEGKKLREHLENNDLSYGCKHCQHYLEKKKFSGLKPIVFDKYSEYLKQQLPKVLEFSLENTCNLECIMCSGEVSSSIRKNRDKLPVIESPFDAEFVKQLEPFICNAKEAKFYGGEPFMIPIYFDIWDKIYSLNPTLKLFVITNGTKLNKRVKEVLSRQNFEIAVSIDGATPDTFHKIRKNADFEKVMANLDYFNQYCLGNGYPLTISFTAMRENWHELPQIVELCNKIKAHLYISYIHKPYHLALWNLPSSKLSAIISRLKKFNLPLDSFLVSYKKFNKQAFNDFIVYLEGCYETNLKTEAKSTSSTTLTHSSENDATILVLKESKGQGLGEFSILPDAPETFNQRAQLYMKQLNNNEIKIFNSKIDYLKQNSNLSDSVFYSLLCIAPIEVLYKDVLELSESTLLQIVQSKAKLIA